jgi:hypothetical protein
MLMHFTGTKMSNKKFGTRYNTTTFTEKAREIHGNKFEYSLVMYTNSYTKIDIICPTHGVFSQRPCDHINQKQGCPKCSHNSQWTHDQYSIRSNELFKNKFKIISEYKGMKHPITLQCIEHGEFTLKKAEKHLEKNGGCPVCWKLGKLENLKPGNISKVEKQWLDSLNVPIRQHKITLNDKVFIVDGFDPSTNTVYECYGSFWHGNPNKYSQTDINTKIGIPFGDLYQKTIIRENIIKEKYNLVTHWI